MKGLLIKDIRILLRQKTTLFIILALGIFMSMNGGNPSFSLGYMMVVSATLVITTISYDYFERGMVFLFTLPVRRRDYVMEKYLLMLLVELAVGAVALVMQFCSSFIGQQADWDIFLSTGVGCMISATLIMSVYIPVHLKFGPEKSRIAIFGVVGVIALVTYMGYKVRGFQKMMEQLVMTLSRMSMAQAAGIGALIWVLIMAASIGSSLRIMEKKEF